MISIGIVLMVSALYESYGWAGALTATNVLAWALGNAILSRLVDRYGQARVMIPALIIAQSAMIYLVLAAWVQSPVWVLFAPTALNGLAGGSAGALVRARWNHALDGSSLLHTAFSLESTLDEVTYIIGPLVATALSTMVHPTAGLIAPVVLSLVGGLWFYYFLRGTQPPVRRRPLDHIPVEEDEPQDRQAPVAATLQRDRFVLAFGGMVSVLLVTALFGGVFGALDVSIVAATTAWDARSMAGLVLAGMSLGSAAAGLAYGARHWKAPLPKRFLIGVAVFAILMPLYLLAHNAPVLTICGFLAGSAIAPSFTNANSLVTVLVPKHRLTEGLSWIGTSIGLGVALGSSFAGWLIDRHGYVAGYWTAVIAVMISLVLAIAGYQILRHHAALRSD